MVVHLLHGIGCEDDQMVVAVAAALDGLEIIALRRLDRTQSRTAALAVDDQTRELGAGQITEPLGHQRNAGTRRRGHDPLAGSGASVDHVDRRHLRLGLQHDHAGRLPGLELHEGLHHFRLRRNGVAEITVATVADRSMGDHFVALHQFNFLFCHSLLEFLTINRYHAIGADDRTRSTARAGFGIGHADHRITLAIDFDRQLQHAARTRCHANPASFATLLVDNDRSFDFSHTPWILIVTNIGNFSVIAGNSPKVFRPGSGSDGRNREYRQQ